MTGYDFPAADNGAAPIKPGLGSILSRYRGATGPDGLPTYVRFRGILGDGPAWLGRQYAPFDVGGKARDNMNLRVTLDRSTTARSLLKTFDTARPRRRRPGLMTGLDSFETQAFDLILGKARDAFDVTREDPRLRDRYGPGARRAAAPGPAPVRGGRRLRDRALRRLGHARADRDGDAANRARRSTRRSAPS